MTTALDDLIAKVEAGSEDLNRSLPWSRAIGVDDGLYAHARDAYRGSLDAALALHNAVLPGWHWCAGWTTGEPEIVASAWPREEEWQDHDATAETAGRALLLAILRAMRERDNG